MSEEHEKYEEEDYQEELEQEAEEEEQEEQEEYVPPPGYQDEEAWAANGRDPAKWVDPETYRARGSLHKQMDTLKRESAEQRAADKREFEQRLSGANQIHQFTLEQQRNALQKQLDEAIAGADSEAAQGVIAEMEKNRDAQTYARATQPVQQAPAIDPAIQDFNERNPWIDDANSPKASYMHAKYNQYAETMAIPDAIRQAEADVMRAFPQTNQARSRAPAAEGGGGPGATRSGRAKTAPTMQTLTASEEKAYNAMSWSSDKDFLKAVADTRQEEG